MAEHAARAAEKSAARAEGLARTTKQGTQIMYVPRERRLTKLRGRPRDNGDIERSTT